MLDKVLLKVKRREKKRTKDKNGEKEKRWRD